MKEPRDETASALTLECCFLPQVLGSEELKRGECEASLPKEDSVMSRGTVEE